MTYIWSIILIVSITFALFTGNVLVLEKVILTSSYEALLSFGMIASSIILWSGILEVAIQSGFLKVITLFMKPIIRPLFRTKDEEALNYIAANLTCNLLSLGSAATPFALKAMQKLEEENPRKDKETKDMATLVIMNACGFSLMPTTLIALRLNYGGKQNSFVIFYIILISFVVTVIMLSLNWLVSKWK